MGGITNTNGPLAREPERTMDIYGGLALDDLEPYLSLVYDEENYYTPENVSMEQNRGTAFHSGLPMGFGNASLIEDTMQFCRTDEVWSKSSEKVTRKTTELKNRTYRPTKSKRLLIEQMLEKAKHKEMKNRGKEISISNRNEDRASFKKFFFKKLRQRSPHIDTGSRVFYFNPNVPNNIFNKKFLTCHMIEENMVYFFHNDLKYRVSEKFCTKVGSN